MNKKLINLTFEKMAACSKDVALWNYWDHEHLDIVHAGYKSSDIIYEDKNFMYRVDKIRVPLIPFINFQSTIIMYQENENTIKTFAKLFGILSTITITITEISKKTCKINMNYKFFLDGWKIILKKILEKLITIWNQKVWLEDLPIKLRRQKILDLGFIDFKGLPNKILDRRSNKEYKLVIPIKRPKKLSRDLHPSNYKK